MIFARTSGHAKVSTRAQQRHTQSDGMREAGPAGPEAMPHEAGGPPQAVPQDADVRRYMGRCFLNLRRARKFALPVDSNSLNLSPYIEYSKAEIPLRLAPCLVIAGAGLATGGGTH